MSQHSQAWEADVFTTSHLSHLGTKCSFSAKMVIIFFPFLDMPFANGLAAPPTQEALCLRESGQECDLH